MNDLDLIETLWATPTPADAAEAEARHEAPALTGVQRQGDLLLIPANPVPALQLLAAVRLDDHPLTLLESEHAHQVTGRGGATWAPAIGPQALAENALGVLTVPDGGTAWLTHTGHHAPLAVGRGRYVVRQQRTHTPTPIRPTATSPATPPAASRRPTPEPIRAQPTRDGAPRWRTVWD